MKNLDEFGTIGDNARLKGELNAQPENLCCILLNVTMLHCLCEINFLSTICHSANYADASSIIVRSA